MNSHNNPKLNPLVHNGNEIERNRKGSPYVEMDISSDDAIKTIGAYYIDLQARHDYWLRKKAQWTAPELLPSITQVEMHLLESLVRHDGKVNFWDANIEMISSSDQSNGFFNDGCEKFIDSLGLEIKSEE